MLIILLCALSVSALSSSSLIHLSLPITPFPNPPTPAPSLSQTPLRSPSPASSYGSKPAPLLARRTFQWVYPSVLRCSGFLPRSARLPPRIPALAPTPQETSSPAWYLHRFACSSPRRTIARTPTPTAPTLPRLTRLLLRTSSEPALRNH